MAETAQMSNAEESQVYRGQPQSMVSAAALLIAGILTFSMGINRLYFVEAMAWTFLIWGALLLYGHIIDLSTTYEVTPEGLVIRSPMRFWALSRKWDWAHITRMDLVVGRYEADDEDVVMQVHYTPEGSTVLYREDLPYYPALAQEIAERAELKPQRGQAMQSFSELPQDEKGTFTWK